MRTLIAGTLGIAALVACGGTENQAASAGAGGESAGPGGSGATGGSGAGGDGGAGGAGGGGVCEIPKGAMHIDVKQGGGAPGLGCSRSETTIELDGTIVAASAGQYQLDTCLPTQDCDATSIWTLEVDYQGLVPVIPVGTFVHATYSFGFPSDSGCKLGLALHNLPSFGGVANPTSSGEHLWLFAADGLGDSGLPIDTPEWCTGDDGMGSMLSVRALSVQADNGPDGGPYTIPPGGSQEVEYTGGTNAGYYVVTNVSVYSCCVEVGIERYGVVRKP